MGGFGGEKLLGIGQRTVVVYDYCGLLNGPPKAMACVGGALIGAPPRRHPFVTFCAPERFRLVALTLPAALAGQSSRWELLSKKWSTRIIITSLIGGNQETGTHRAWRWRRPSGSKRQIRSLVGSRSLLIELTELDW